MNNHHPGPLIRQIRLARGMSTYELERVTGMRRCNLSRYERCVKHSLRSLEPLYPIAQALGTSVPAIFMVHEICIADPSILENREALIGLLEKARHAIDWLQPKKQAA